eukprot:scaffold64632_cov31-Tisochrysis_lutea.AAC.1
MRRFQMSGRPMSTAMMLAPRARSTCKGGETHHEVWTEWPVIQRELAPAACTTVGARPGRSTSTAAIPSRRTARHGSRARRRGRLPPHSNCLLVGNTSRGDPGSAVEPR